MTPEPADQRLSRISTQWTLLARAHGAETMSGAAARQVLMQRYCGAVYRYLLGAVRDEDAAGELFQEFALRFLQGRFRGADARKGRFRDYVKTSLSHLVTDLRRRQKSEPGPLPADFPATSTPIGEAAELEGDFARSWREELVHQAWQALAEAQPALHVVLLAHTESPEMTSAELADVIAKRTNKPMTPGNVRVTLHRAREKFADLLLDEVERSLEHSTREELVAELRELHLLELCAPALERRTPAAPS